MRQEAKSTRGWGPHYPLHGSGRTLAHLARLAMRAGLIAAAASACVPQQTEPEQRAGDGAAPAPARSGAVRRSARARRPAHKSGPRSRPPTSAVPGRDPDPPSLGSRPGSGVRRPTAQMPPGNPTAPITEVFLDTFDRVELGAHYHATSPAWRLKAGRLCAQGARNHPTWLKRKLPTNARIEFDASSSSPDGDIKVEAWGDGKTAAQSTSYTQASSYLFILGGWKNRFHVLARLNEHDPRRLQIKVDADSGDYRARPVELRHPYHFKIERNDGRTVRWLVDDIELFGFLDPEPLEGAGHEHFAFNNWQVPVCFDNLTITPLEGE